MSTAWFRNPELQPLTTHNPTKNIHILDTGFHPLATSRKVCGAWRRQSEAKGRWHSARHWLTPAIGPVLTRRTWLHGSSAINRLLHGSKVGNAGLMWLNSLFSHGPLGSIRQRYWQLLKPPRSSTTVYKPKQLTDVRSVLAPTSGARRPGPGLHFPAAAKLAQAACEKLTSNRESLNT